MRRRYLPWPLGGASDASISNGCILRCLSLRCRGLKLAHAQGQPGQKQKCSCENFQKASLPPHHSHRQCLVPHASPSTRRSSPRVFTRFPPPCIRGVCLRLRRQFSTICPCPPCLRAEAGSLLESDCHPSPCQSGEISMRGPARVRERSVVGGETEAPRGGGEARIHLYELVLLPPL